MGFTAFLCSKSTPFGHTNHYTKFSKSGASGLTLCLMSTETEAQTVKGLLAVIPAASHTRLAQAKPRAELHSPMSTLVSFSPYSISGISA